MACLEYDYEVAHRLTPPPPLAAHTFQFLLWRVFGIVVIVGTEVVWLHAGRRCGSRGLYSTLGDRFV